MSIATLFQFHSNSPPDCNSFNINQSIRGWGGNDRRNKPILSSLSPNGGDNDGRWTIFSPTTISLLIASAVSGASVGVD